MMAAIMMTTVMTLSIMIAIFIIYYFIASMKAIFLSGLLSGH